MLKLNLSCPNHPKYNPADGEGSMRGGCIWCHELIRLYTAAMQFNQDVMRRYLED